MSLETAIPSYIGVPSAVQFLGSDAVPANAMLVPEEIENNLVKASAVSRDAEP